MKNLTIRELDEYHFRNTLKSSKSLFKTTKSYMEEYLKEFGIDALCNVFNQVAKQEDDLYRAELIAKVEVL